MEETARRLPGRGRRFLRWLPVQKRSCKRDGSNPQRKGMIAPFRKVQILLFPAPCGWQAPGEHRCSPFRIRALQKASKVSSLVCVELFFCHFVFPSFFGSTYITNEVGAISRKNRKLPKRLQKAPFLTILLHWIGRKETNP